MSNAEFIEIVKAELRRSKRVGLFRITVGSDDELIDALDLLRLVVADSNDLFEIRRRLGIG